MSDSWPISRVVELMKLLEEEAATLSTGGFSVDAYKDWEERARRKLEVSSPKVHSSFKTASGGGLHMGMDLAEFYRNSFAAKRRTLNAWREALELEVEQGSAPLAEQERRDDARVAVASRKVFIVHGRNVGVMREVESFVRSLLLEPVILQDQPNLGRTLIEKFEQNADVSYAIIVMTGDDLGVNRDEHQAGAPLKRRARQNVVLELGFFAGRLLRSHIAVLYEEGVEMPSDFDGVAYILLDPHEGWKFKLQRELNEYYKPTN